LLRIYGIIQLTAFQRNLTMRQKILLDGFFGMTWKYGGAGIRGLIKAGKKSDMDIRIDPDLPIEQQIPKGIKKAVGKGKIPELVRNVEKAVNYVKEYR
jgi:hypothetical protein